MFVQISHLPHDLFHVSILDLVTLIMYGEYYKLWGCLLCTFVRHPVASSLLVRTLLFSTLFSNTFCLQTDETQSIIKHEGRAVISFRAVCLHARKWLRMYGVSWRWVVVIYSQLQKLPSETPKKYTVWLKSKYPKTEPILRYGTIRVIEILTAFTFCISVIK